MSLLVCAAGYATDYDTDMRQGLTASPPSPQLAPAVLAPTERAPASMYVGGPWTEGRSKSLRRMARSIMASTWRHRARTILGHRSPVVARRPSCAPRARARRRVVRVGSRSRSPGREPSEAEPPLSGRHSSRMAAKSSQAANSRSSLRSHSQHSGRSCSSSRRTASQAGHASGSVFSWRTTASTGDGDRSGFGR